MYRVHEYKYVPILIGAEKRYRIELPLGMSPVLYKTMTTDMRSWVGQIIKTRHGHATAFIREAGTLISIEGELIENVSRGSPCIVMEHLNIDGEMGLMIGENNILNDNLNFINFGLPQGKHVRIDIYTGESKVID